MRRPEGGWRLRFPDEATACPACGSPRLRMIDVFSIPRTASGRGVSFATGCRACGLLFTNPLPAPEELEQYYGTNGPWSELRASRMGRIESANVRRQARAGRPRAPKPLPSRARTLFDALRPYVPIYAPPPGGKVLDFGCGDGKLLNRLQDLGWETHGIEPSADAPFVRHTRHEHPPRDGSFDFVMVNHVLEHLLDPLDTLRGLAGSLREGGILFVSVPRLDTLPEHGDRKYCLSGRNHVMCFSETCLRGLLARAGCTTVARLDGRDLDEVFTEGKPLRLRLVAMRTAQPPPLPRRPLAAAVRAFGTSAAPGAGMTSRLRGLLPVRVRAALMTSESRS